MVSTDPISDMLTRVRNAMLIGSREVSLPFSKVKEQTLKVLTEANYIKSYKVEDTKPQKTIHITIAGDGESFKINEMKRISKPGRRQYSKANEMPRIMNGRGMLIVSTPKGMMTGDDAKSKGLGGELICSVY